MLLLCSPDMKSNTGKIFRDMGLKIIDIPKSIYTVDGAFDAIKEYLKRGNANEL